jgi:hypothetical protein
VTWWLGVVSRDHVRRGVALGIAQIGHGQKAGLARMRVGDGLVYYSPRYSLDDTTPLRAFTAIGTVADEEVFQVDEGEFRPWRRRVAYDRSALEVPVGQLRHDLDLTRGPNWGYALRRGLLELSTHDAGRIAESMGHGRSPAAPPPPA